MAKFTVYEVQEEVRWRQWAYEVEADSEEEAIDFAIGSGGHRACGEYGDSSLGDSGWSTEGFAEAAEKLGEL